MEDRIFRNSGLLKAFDPFVPHRYSSSQDRGFMTPAPRHIRAFKDKSILELTWPDGLTSRLGFFSLRCACPCAMCADEVSGVRILDVATVARNIRAIDIEICGNYALKFRWSDGHDTGLYTWEQLRRMSAERPDSGP